MRFLRIMEWGGILLLAGCATTGEPGDAPGGGERAVDRIPVPPEYTPAGKVAFVNREAGFVLVAAFEEDRLAPGDRLVVFSDKVEALLTGELRISGERKEYFLVADIVSGEPEIDHGVFLEIEPGSEESYWAPPRAARSYDRGRTGAGGDPGKRLFRKR